MVCAWLLWTDIVDEVWLVPTAAHPFAKQSAPFQQRVNWCVALAQAVGAKVVVSTVEAELPQPNFTITTLEHLASQHPSRVFRLVVGADVLAETDKWKDWARISGRFAPIVVGRTGYASPEGMVVFPRVSSTEIRARMRAGEPVDHLVPASVHALL
jgi:nicotinate-nucleotide adenylyltransferase